MKPIGMPVSRLTTDCIWRSFQNSGCRHIILTGSRGCGKTTLLSGLFSFPIPGITTYAVPQQGVYLKNNRTGETTMIGKYEPDPSRTENLMKPIKEAFLSKGISFLNALKEVASEWISIDEIGYLEDSVPEYLNTLYELMEQKHLLMVVRKQNLAFIRKLRQRSDTLVIDLDQPYGKSGCIIMASGQGKRFGSNKLLIDFGGKPLIQWAIDASKGLFCKQLVVTIHPEIEDLCHKQNIPVLLHQSPLRNDMIRKGLQSIELGIDRCAFLPADQPLIRSDSIAALLLCSQNEPSFIWRTYFGNRTGSPVLFPARFFHELKSLPPKSGGSMVVSQHIQLCRTVQTEVAEELKDIDTYEDLSVLSQYIR